MQSQTKDSNSVNAQSLEVAWKRHSSSGNTFYHSANHTAALAAYECAFCVVERLLYRPVECQRYHIALIPIYLNTCANLGNTLTLLERFEEAEEWFQRALRLASVTADMNSPALGNVFSSQPADLKMAILNYNDFCQRTARTPDTQAIRRNKNRLERKI